jgi:F-type H+-transporting ATPase subunit delta
MSTRASATRYARALFDVALKESSVEQVEADLGAFADLVQQHPDVQRVLTSPAVPVLRKRALVEALLARLALGSSIVTRILLLITDRDRLAVLPDLLAVYRERLREPQHVIEAEVTTASPLSDERAAALRQRLAALTGRDVTMTTKVDPALIGGVVAKVGSVVYDGSVATQLQNIRQRLAGQV